MFNTSRRNLSNDFIEVYTENTVNGIQPRWRMRDGNGEILKTATKFYKSEEEMYAEILLVI
jgi:hypothetical protein